MHLLDQFRLEEDVVVGSGRYLCTPVEKNSEGPPSFPNEHLACYEIAGAPLFQFYSLEDQFEDYLGVLIESPELLCLPSLKYLPESGGPLSLGAGLLLLAWLERRKRISAGCGWGQWCFPAHSSNAWITLVKPVVSSGNGGVVGPARFELATS